MSRDQVHSFFTLYDMVVIALIDLCLTLYMGGFKQELIGVINVILNMIYLSFFKQSMSVAERTLDIWKTAGG